MGLFDALRRLFGSDSSTEDPDGTGGTTDETHGGTHGSHWDAVAKGEDIQEVVMNAVEAGEPVEATSSDGSDVVGYVDGPSECRTCTVTVSGMVWTAYPEVEGVVHEVTVERELPWDEEGIEAQRQVTLGDASFVLFDTRHFEQGESEPGETREFTIAGVAYNLFEAEEETVVAQDGEELSMAGMAGLFPFEDGQPDDYAFQTTIKEIEELAYRGQTVYQFRMPLFRQPAEESDDYVDVDVYLYAAEHVVDGFEPTVGDDIRGLVWLQGHAV